MCEALSLEREWGVRTPASMRCSPMLLVTLPNRNTVHLKHHSPAAVSVLCRYIEAGSLAKNEVLVSWLSVQGSSMY